MRAYERAMALEVDQANLTAAIGWALASERFDDAMVIFASPFGDLLMLQGTAQELASRWMETALEHRDAISPGTLVWALEVAGSIARVVSGNDTWLTYATLGIENARSTEERLWFELTAAMATNLLEGHTAATDAMFDRVIDQADDPGMQASALLAKAKFGPPTQAWALVEQALGLAPIDAFVWWDEVSACTRIVDSAGDSGHYDIATQLEERALELSRRSGWVMVETQSAAQLSWLYAARGRLDEAAALIAEAVPVARRILGPTLSRPLVPSRAASIARQQGRFDEACSYAEESLREAEQTEIGVWGEATALGAIRESALIARDEGDLDQAQDKLGYALQRLEGFDHVSLGPWIRAELRTTRASVALRRNDPHGALEDLRGVLAKPENLSHAVALIAVDFTAIALAQQGKAGQAARLLGSVDQERERTGLVIRPPDEPLRESAIHDTQSILGDTWGLVVNQGSTMTLGDAVEYAADQIDADNETADVHTVVDGTSLT